MKLREIRDILEAEVLSGEAYLDRDVYAACGADLMSDVLAFVKNQSVLLTGLLNPQMVRTAEMMDICCIIIVWGKIPDAQTVKLTDDKNIVFMTTKNHMYAACGKLYSGGLFQREGI